MKRILSFGVIAGLGVMLGCPIYSDDGGTTQPGDCTIDGCPSGQTCKLQNGTPQCVANSGNDAGPAPYSGCFSDSECTSGDGGGAGFKCLNAQCTAPADQCADETQCGANEQCVQGVCTPSCATTQCPTGYSCDSNKVCTGNPNACTVPGGACGSNGICIEGHCDTKCGPNNTCSAGEVCVNGGCMPNQKANFICTGADGTQSECASGSVCLRHNCYISCAGDPNVCATADQFNQCKSVTTTSGSFSVCGSATNLGSDCDPTIGKNCAASGVCIDGYCH